jgi:hypothetical protein
MRRRVSGTLAGAALLLCGVVMAAAAAEPAPSLLPRAGLEPLQGTPPPGGGTATLAPRHVSVYKAAALSALLPGLGEVYAGHPTRALVSGTAEAGLWISYATFKVQEDLRGDRAIDFAVAYAGARPGADDAYFKAVGQYMRAEGPGMWNEFVRRKQRDTGEVVGREYAGSEAWAWTDENRFVDYRLLRRDMLSAGDHASNTLALLLVNRVVSIVSVVQAVRGDHRRETERLGLRFESGASPFEPLARVGVWSRF